MDENIEIYGIETNNLKNIDVSIKKDAINLILGPSGSGKSSLAYDTIAQIGQYEYMSMFADDYMEPKYKVKGYRHMIANLFQSVKRISIIISDQPLELILA